MKLSLLDALDTKEICSTAMMAEKIGSSCEMVTAQLERYEQLGFVKKTVMDTSSQCGGGCKSCKGCSHKKQSVPVTFWEKVERA
ncbi:MAG: hypothetical protein IJZ55_08270 [Lachnospiraceae bacterium]|nr:hypothetical protein [Lachnospiraceae bacterium]